MSVYKSGSTKLMPFKPSLRTPKMRVDVLTDNLNRIVYMIVTVGKKETPVKLKNGNIKQAWKEVKEICEKALKSQNSRQK